MGGNNYQKKKNALTEEDIKNAINKGDGDGYIFDIEYQRLQKENERLQREYEKARDQYARITRELREEMENGTETVADEARFMALLSDKGVELQQQQEEMEKAIDKIADERVKVDNELAQLRKVAFGGMTRAPSEPASEEKYRGFKPYKGKEKVVEMSPSEYLRRSAFQFGNGTMESLLKSASPSLVEKIARQMRRGTGFDAPSLDYGKNESHGNARAIAALLNGYKRIPVLILE